MRAAATAIGMTLGAIGVFPSQATAQNEVYASIEEFNGLPWGAPAGALEERFGSPLQTDTLENGVVVMAYRDSLLNLPVAVLYALLPDQGLVKGQYVVELDVEAGDCEGQYGRLRDHVKLTYPLITPVESSSYPYHADFCAAVREGAGQWATQWTDRSTGSVVTVIVERGTHQVKLIFESVMFLDWLGVSLSPEEERER